jgi:hypothetical protein
MFLTSRRACGLAAIVSVGSLVLVPGTAFAAAKPKAVAADCTPSVSPTSVIVGKTSKAATFDVTGCDFYDWTLDSESDNGPFWDVYQDSPSETFYTADLENDEAGAETVAVGGYDSDYDEIYNQPTKISFLRRSYWPSFNASPEPVKKGAKMKVTAKLDRISWDSDAYAGYGGRVVHLQRKLPGGAYEDYKTFTLDSTGHLNTTITASSTATWRMRYAGNSVTGGSTSSGDNVVVN